MSNNNSSMEKPIQVLTFEHFTDEKLFMLCKNYGEKARYFRQKFIGLLPEVYKRKLYEKKGFGSIFEFAAKLCGLSEEQVRRVLNLEKKLEKTPMLHSLLVHGEVSTNKLLRITSIATKDNEEFLATQVRLLPKSALETLVRDEKYLEKGVVKSDENQELFQDEIGFPQAKEEAKSVPGHDLNLSKNVKLKLLELQQKGININDLLLEFLEKREEEIKQEKENLTQEMSGKMANTPHENLENHEKKPSRYIPKKVRNLLKKEHGKKCSIPTCQRKSEQIHHTQRFGLAATVTSHTIHDPRYLAPLCKNHHTIAHTIDIKYHQVRQKVLC